MPTAVDNDVATDNRSIVLEQESLVSEINELNNDVNFAQRGKALFGKARNSQQQPANIKYGAHNFIVAGSRPMQS